MPNKTQSTEQTQQIEQERQFNTPMMEQYFSIKKRYPECLLFFRLGDFYELFLDDAKIGSQVMDVALTNRFRGKDGAVPMCGVPYHAIESYLSRIIKAGYKAAICEQLTEPEPGKKLVERDVIRVITPGTALIDSVLSRKENNYIASLSITNGSAGISIADISTGKFFLIEIDPKQIESEIVNNLSKFSVAELIVSQRLFGELNTYKTIKNLKSINIYHYNDWDTHIDNAHHSLTQHFELSNLKTIGVENHFESVKAASVLLGYLKSTQKTDLVHIKDIKLLESHDFVYLDRSTIQNLELFQTMYAGEKKGSLIDLIDKTTTSIGGRKLREWLVKPLKLKQDILNRQQKIKEFLTNKTLTKNCIDALSEISDIERLLSRLSIGVGNARDVNNLKQSLIKSVELNRYLNHETDTNLVELTQLIDKYILDQVPYDIKKGNLIKPNAVEELDKIKDQISESKVYIEKLEEREKMQTNIASLKVRFNQVFGYYIEVTKSNLENVPAHYIRKQTLVNAERFTTPELTQHEQIILGANETINEIELRTFNMVVEEITKNSSVILNQANFIAENDCYISLAIMADLNNWNKPNLTEELNIKIIDGKHPVVEHSLEDNLFITNNTCLNDTQKLHIITGPNMGGKSVYIRQVAIITLLAHIGSYVPAKHAEIALIEKIFVRSGAGDNISMGISTFMMEMIETANIINNTTERSLIVMDEIGRGTSTYDGISIAWSVAEHLVNKYEQGPLILFATHYHELQDLEEQYQNKIKNYHVGVAEDNEELVLTHKVHEGKSSYSFGLNVAKKAGIPHSVIDNANQKLDNLKANPIKETIKNKPTIKENPILAELKELNLNNITPIQALNKLIELKEKINE